MYKNQVFDITHPLNYNVGVDKSVAAFLMNLHFLFPRRHKVSGNARISICCRTRTSKTRYACFDWLLQKADDMHFLLYKEARDDIRRN